MAQVKQVVLFPFPATTHITPFMALAKLIKKRSCYSVTLLNVMNLKSSTQTASESHDIQFFELPFDGSKYGLPGSFNPAELPPHLQIAFLQSTESLCLAFKSFIAELCAIHGTGSVCIVVDLLLGWAVEVGKKLGVFSSLFVTGGAYGTAMAFSIWTNLPHQNSDSDEFTVPDFPEAGLVRKSQLPDHLRNAKEGEPWTCFFQRQMAACLKADGYLLNTVQEVEESGPQYYSRKTGRPVWTIGPISLPVPKLQHIGSMALDPCIQWLNLHPPTSVLYIAFGSMHTISALQMMELAAGLEASGRPFLWAIRQPLGFDPKEEFRDEWLPEGFEVRMAERKQGMLVKKWAPQLEILAHNSTGAFLSHCGWNSTVESLMNGVPMISWPLFAEQYANAKMLTEELGVCVELAWGNSSDIDREHVKRVIEMVMGGTEKGEEMRKKAERVKQMMEAAVIEDGEFIGSSVQALDDFIQTAFTS